MKKKIKPFRVRTTSNASHMLYLGLGTVVILGIGIVIGYFLFRNTANVSKQAGTVTMTTLQTAPTITPTEPSEQTIQQTGQQTAVTPSPKTSPITKAALVATDGWKTVANNGVSFQIPPSLKCNNDTACTLLSDQSGYMPQRISVDTYNGGSRRAQFLGPSPDDCHYIYQDMQFGSIKALEISGDGGWCQGGSGGIVTVLGSKFIVFYNSNYDATTKKVYRNDVRDTIISTLRLQ